MDPNVTLQQLRDAIERFRAAADSGDGDAEHEAAADMADRAEALDQWLCRQGFPAEGWIKY
jgi:hypothetical protein